MTRSVLPHSVRKFLRREKARLRREILNSEEAERKLQELVKHARERYNRNRGHIVVNLKSEAPNPKSK